MYELWKGGGRGLGPLLCTVRDVRDGDVIRKRSQAYVDACMGRHGLVF